MRKPSDDMDLYAVLGIERSATESRIRKAYRQAALRTHPDKLGGSLQAFHKVAIAFEILSCPQARNHYNSRFLSTQCERANLMRSQNSKTDTKAYASMPSAGGAHRISVKKRPYSHPLDPASCSGRQRLDSKMPKTNRLARPPITTSDSSSSEFPIRTFKALSKLQDILQFLSPQSRLACVKSQLNEDTRIALTKFIEGSRKKCDASTCNHSCTHRAYGANSKDSDAKRAMKTHDRAPLSGFSGIRATSGSHYKAYMDIKALRVYTRSHSLIEDAIDQHIALVSLRHALREASRNDPEIWDTSDGSLRIYSICKDVFKAHGTSEDDLGLSAIVSLRADRWLGRGQHVTSSMMPLAEALRAHARLLNARNVSWMALRSEWVRLMLNKKRALKIGLSSAEAQSRADDARQIALNQKLARVLGKVTVALDEERQRTIRALRSKSRKIEMEIRQKKLNARKAMRARNQASKMRWQWLKRRDLTTEEILFGVPPVQPRRA
jgi:curved DNA-binding protein CbpA